MSDPNDSPDFHLRIDAHALVQLGEQLITDDEQAILELVKNSYDADAQKVKIRIESDYVPTENDHVPSEAVGLIEIEDDGVGMDQKGIADGWLMISVSMKRQQKLDREPSKLFGRLPLGDKGLGRLGTMKLGKWLSVETRSAKDKEGWAVSFQWADIKSGVPLEKVPINWARVAANDKTGTTVRIFGLRSRESWRNDKRRRKLQKNLSGLISPFAAFQSFDIALTLEDHAVELVRVSAALRKTATVRFDYDWDGNRLLVSGRVKMIWFRKRPEEFDKYIAPDNGMGLLHHLQEDKSLKAASLTRADEPGWFVSVNHTITKNFLPFEKEEAVDPGPFSGSLDHFDLDVDINLPKILGTETEYRALVKDLAQIYIYRDGFGIRMPNDWLQLGAAWTSQTGFYSLKPSNSIGFFELSVAQNAGLSEKSDREGFTDNLSWRGFRLLADQIRNLANKDLNRLGKGTSKFLNEASGEHSTDDSAKKYSEVVNQLDALLMASESLKRQIEQRGEARSIALRRAEGAARMASLDGKQDQKQRERAKQLLETIESIQVGLESDYAEIRKFTETLTQQKELASIVRRRIADFEERSHILYEMVGTGLTAQALAHDVPAILHHLEDHAKSIAKLIKLRDVDKAKIAESAENIRGGIAGVQQMMDFVQPMLRGRRLTRRRAMVSEFVKSFLDLRGARLFARGIAWHVESEGMRDFEISINPGRLIQILDNLTTNSEYWIEQRHGAKSTAGRIGIEIVDPNLIFFDNGPGVRPDLEESLFEMFTSGRDEDEGNGLGLFITQELLHRDNCSIALDSKRNDQKRLFRFVLNLSGVKSDK
jgi:signal transduction histidine kinase